MEVKADTAQIEDTSGYSRSKRMSIQCIIDRKKLVFGITSVLLGLIVITAGLVGYYLPKNAAGINGDATGYQLTSNELSDDGNVITGDLFPASHSGLLASSLAGRIPYILRGKDVEPPGKYPWMAAILKWGSINCGASLVSEIWLVTAAHCVLLSPNAYTIILGAHDVITKKQGSPQRYKVADIIRHPKYDPSASAGQAGDIALIKLASPANLTNQYISTIALPKEDESFWGMTCTVIGWGWGGDNVLQEMDVEVWSLDKCGPWTYKGDIYHTCVYKAGSAVCPGDSGGPLQCKKDGQYKLAGASSYSWGCHNKRAPDIYTSVHPFRAWIRETSGL